MRVNPSSRSYGITLSTIAYSYRWLAFIALLLLAYAPECSQASELALTLTEKLLDDKGFRVFKAKEPGAFTEMFSVHFPIPARIPNFNETFERLQTISAKTKGFPDQQYLALPASGYPGSKCKFLDSDEFLRGRKFTGNIYPSIVYPLFRDGDLWSFLNSLQKTQSLLGKATILSISRSILKGLKLLHEKARVIHGSLHTQNIWLRRINDNYSASIVNMGIYLPIGVPTKRYVVSRGYIPYEHRSTYFTPGSTLVPAASFDVFSFGSVLYQLTMGEVVDQESLVNAQGKLQSRSHPGTKLEDSPWQFIISKCWSKDNRTTVDTILKWLDEVESLPPPVSTGFKITRKLSGTHRRVRLYQAQETSDISMTLLVKVSNEDNGGILETELQNLRIISNVLTASGELHHVLLYAPGYPNLLNRIELPNGDLGLYALVLPFAREQSLLSFLQKHINTPIEESQILSIAKSVLGNLKVLHERVGMVHSDLKPENIVLHPDGQTSLMDFAFATSIGQETDRFANSEGYRPPEALSGIELKMETSFDVYAFGSLLYELMETGNGFQRIHLKCAQRRYSDVSRPSESLFSIVESCWKSKPAKRPFIDHILKMLQEYEDAQKSVRCTNRVRRPSSRKIFSRLFGQQ